MYDVYKTKKLFWTLFLLKNLNQKITLKNTENKRISNTPTIPFENICVPRLHPEGFVVMPPNSTNTLKL